MRKIAVLNQKGGVGKTTSVANIAAALAAAGLKVLVADFDPQAHLTIHLGIDADTEGNGSYEVLTKSVPMSEAMINVRPNLHLLGANIDLVGAESELVSVVGRETIFAEALRPIEDQFDYLIIDCPPSLSLLSLNALAAVEEVFIPIQPHFLALQGFGKLLQTVTLVNNRINPSLRITAILLCMFDTRVTLSAEVKTDIDNFLTNARQQNTPWSDAVIVPVHIRRNIKLAEAPSHGKTIFEYEPDCNGAHDYQAIAEFIHTQMKTSFATQMPQLPVQQEPPVEQSTEENTTPDHQLTEDTPEPHNEPQIEQQDSCEQPQPAAEQAETPTQHNDENSQEQPQAEKTTEPQQPQTFVEAEQHDTQPQPELNEHTHEQPHIPIQEIPQQHNTDNSQQTQQPNHASYYDFEKLNYKPHAE